MISTGQYSAPLHVDREPICSLGKWLFVPDRRTAGGDIRAGYLACNGERVVLRYCSGIMVDFVRAVREIEKNFTTRCAGTDAPPSRA
jgi:hypothetical protein